MRHHSLREQILATIGAVEFRVKCIELNIAHKFTISLKYGD
jgi:hypothetical protein